MILGGALAPCLLAVAGVTAATNSRAASFTPLGDLPGGGVFGAAYGVSADGVVVVGESQGASGTEAIRWTLGSGLVGLGDLAGGGTLSFATGVSDDGSTADRRVALD